MHKYAVLYIMKTSPIPYYAINNQAIIDSAVGLDNRLPDSGTIYILQLL